MQDDKPQLFYPCIECGIPHSGIKFLMCADCWAFWRDRMVRVKPKVKR